MSDPTSQAFVILLVGMITIFSILALVVISGNVLIRLVNRYFPATPVRTSPVLRKEPTFSPSTLAAIVATVEWVTAGKGHITSIQAVENNK
ncbi:MAG: OadG family transporter subunit [Bacteroidota bacterium]